MADEPKKKYRIEFADLAKHLGRVLTFDDAELMLLKTHLLVERVLVATVAARLREDDHEAVPKMPYGTLIDLACQHDEERKTLIWFNDLRNALAHEFDALDGSEFRKKIERFDMPWPKQAAARAGVMRALVNYVILLSLQTYFDNMANQLTLERAPKLSKEAEPFLEQAVKIRDAMEKAKESLERTRSIVTSTAEGEEPAAIPPPPTLE